MSISREVLLNAVSSHGTPLYVYDLETVRQRYRDLKEHIKWPGFRVLYAMKANYNAEILKTLEKEGAFIDAVSPGDVLMALECGFTPERIMYTANNITNAEMDLVMEKGILFNVGSLSRLKKLGKKYPGSRVCLRFNPDVVAGAHKKIQTGGDLTKFGILLSEIAAVKSTVSEYKLKVVGLHKHTGSGIKETELFLKAVNNLLSIATVDNFPDLEFVDFGGGFAVPYHPEEERIDYSVFGAQITGKMAEFSEGYGREIGLYFEPGKFLVAESGHLLVTVNTIKNNNGRMIAGTDSGFPQLIRPVFYDAYHHILNLTNPEGESEAYDICGNICETGDCFATQRELPEVREGDVLDIENAGAYCYSMGGNYNLRPMPAEVVVDGDEVTLIRERQSVEELITSIRSQLR